MLANLFCSSGKSTWYQMRAKREKKYMGMENMLSLFQ